MNLKQLRERGGIVASAPVKKTITWKHNDDLSGEVVEDVFDVHVMHLSFGLVEAALQSAAGQTQRAGKAALIAEAILLGDKANEKFTYEDAYQLKPTLAYALYKAIAEVNALPQGKPPNDEEEEVDPTDPKA